MGVDCIFYIKQVGSRSEGEEVLRTLIADAANCPWTCGDAAVHECVDRHDERYFELRASYGLTLLCGPSYAHGGSTNVLWVQGSSLLRLKNEKRMQYDLMQWFDKVLGLEGDARSQVGGDSGQEEHIRKHRIDHDEVYCEEGHPDQEECEDFPDCDDCSMRSCPSGYHYHFSYLQAEMHGFRCPKCKQTKVGDGSSESE